MRAMPLLGGSSGTRLVTVLVLSVWHKANLENGLTIKGLHRCTVCVLCNVTYNVLNVHVPGMHACTCNAYGCARAINIKRVVHLYN